MKRTPFWTFMESTGVPVFRQDSISMISLLSPISWGPWRVATCGLVMHGPTTVRGALEIRWISTTIGSSTVKKTVHWDWKTPPMNSGDVFVPCVLGLGPVVIHHQYQGYKDHRHHSVATVVPGPHPQNHHRLQFSRFNRWFKHDAFPHGYFGCFGPATTW